MYTEITTVESALKALGHPEDSMPNITGIPEEFIPALEATYKALVLAKAIRQGWNPDYETNSSKWESWYILRKSNQDPSGFRFGGSGCTGTRTGSVLGPLLCQETEEKSDFLGKQLVEIWKPVLTKE